MKFHKCAINYLQSSRLLFIAIIIIISFGCKRNNIVWLPADTISLLSLDTLQFPEQEEEYTGYRLYIYNLKNEINLQQIRNYPHFPNDIQDNSIHWTYLDSIDHKISDRIKIFISLYISDTLTSLNNSLLISGYYSYISITGNKKSLSFTEMMLIPVPGENIYYLKYEF